MQPFVLPRSDVKSCRSFIVIQRSKCWVFIETEFRASMTPKEKSIWIKEKHVFLNLDFAAINDNSGIAGGPC